MRLSIDKPVFSCILLSLKSTCFTITEKSALEIVPPVHDPGRSPFPAQDRPDTSPPVFVPLAHRTKSPNRFLYGFSRARTRDRERIVKVFMIFSLFRESGKPYFMRFPGDLLGHLLRFIGTFITVYWDIYYGLLGHLLRWITLLGHSLRWIMWIT